MLCPWSQGPMLQHMQGRGPMFSLVALVQGPMPQHVQHIWPILYPDAGTYAASSDWISALDRAGVDVGNRWVAKKFDIPCREVRRETASSLLFTTLAKYIAIVGVLVAGGAVASESSQGLNNSSGHRPVTCQTLGYRSSLPRSHRSQSLVITTARFEDLSCVCGH